MPVDPEDLRWVNQDGDGFPGMTVSINLLGMLEAQICGHITKRRPAGKTVCKTTSEAADGSLDLCSDGPGAPAVQMNPVERQVEPPSGGYTVNPIRRPMEEDIQRDDCDAPGNVGGYLPALK